MPYLDNTGYSRTGNTLIPMKESENYCRECGAMLYHNECLECQGDSKQDENGEEPESQMEE